MREALTFGPGQQRHLPIVTGFLGRGLQTGAITTLGRGGSDLTCTLLGAALGLPEVQVRAGGRPRWPGHSRRDRAAWRLCWQQQPVWAAQTGRAHRLWHGQGPACCSLFGEEPPYCRPRRPPLRARPCAPAAVQVWKDVDGVLTADPRVVDTARPVGQLTFEEATELAFFGATVLHPLAMQPAADRGVNVRVKNSYNR